MEDAWFAPIKEIVKMNIIQYQGPKELYNMTTQDMVKIDPQALRTATLQFKMTDGMTPTEKLLNMELLGQVAQLGMAVPEINIKYDVVGMMLYGFKAMGAHWLKEFERTPQQQQEYIAQKQAATQAAAGPKEQAEAQAIENGSAGQPQLPSPAKVQ
jgi:hypothetical protein